MAGRHRRPNSLGRIAAAILVIATVLVAREASAAPAPPAVALGFSAPVAGTVADRDGEGTGFTSVQPNAAGTHHQPAQLDLSGGRLTVTSTAGDAGANTQQNALQTTFDGTAPYQVSATIRGPLALAKAFQGAGIFVGAGQDDHVKIMVGYGSAGPRLQLAKEQGGAFTSVAAPATPAAATAEAISLTLTVNPATKAVTGSYSLDGGPLQTLGGTTLSSLGTATEKGGILTTHTGGGTPLQVAYDGFVVEPAAAGVAFEPKDVIVSSAPGLQLPTSLALGPDGRLYAAMQNGKILVFDLDASREATHLRTITTIHDRPNHGFDGVTPKSVAGRQVTGIAFDPDLEGGKPVLYVSHSDPEIFKNKEPGQTTVDPASGVLTKLVLDASANVVSATDLVRGLPRSAENHGPNGMAVGPDGWLYLALGGNTNYGKQSFFFGYFPETPLSAAVVRVNPDAIGAPIDASDGARFSWADPCSSGETVGSGCSAAYRLQRSGSANGTVAGKLELYATGFRNPYDLLWHSNGGLYTNENEGNSGFGLTPGAGDELCMGTPFDPGTPPDELFRIQAGGYHGHPAPVRGECLFGGGVGPIATYAPNSSTTGIAEFTSSVFGGAMKGDILSTNYAVGDTLTRVTLGPGGTSVLQKQTLASGLSDPLDVLVHPDGTIFLAEHGGFPGKISALRPIAPATGSGCFPLGPQADTDGDGFTDQDELDNGTGRCNPAAFPPDADGDGRSDLNDPDDDNDGTPDATDPLGLDPTDGTGTALPVRLDFDASDNGGFFGSGFLGVQPSSRGGGALAGRVGAGGAGGFLQVKSTAGTAQGTANTQHNALQQGFVTNAPFTVEAAIGEPFQSGQPQAGEAGGIFLGPGEDDHVRLAVNANGGNPIVELGVEQGGVFTRHPASPALALPAASVRLFLDADRAAGTVTARYRIGAQAAQAIATVAVPASFLASPARAGVMTTMSGSPKADVPFVYEDFAVTNAAPAAAPTTAATLTATHPGRTISTASSYTAGTFTLKNTSTGGEDIVGFTIDLASGPAMWPDIVFDPEDGTPAGDTVGKSFTVDTGTSSGVSASGGHAAPNGDGFSVLDVDTGGFDPGDTLRFSIDIDPTSIRGVSGTPTPPAGGIGGAEMHGATLTVRFSDGSVRTTDISITPGSVTDGRATASAARPVAPGLARLSGGSPAAVSQSSQTVVASGPAGASGVVVVGEGHLNVKDAPGGGFDLDPWEANTAVKLTQVPFTIGSGGTVNVPITLTATPDSDARDIGLNYVTAHLVSGGVPGPVSDPIVLKLGSSPVDTTAPTLTGRQPAPGASGVPVGADAVATFSEAMAPGSISSSSFRLAPAAGGPAVAASIVASAGNTTFTLNPSADLAPGTAYTATVTTGAADAAGNNLASQQTWSFTTAAAPEPGGDGAVTFAGGLAVVEAEDQDAKVARGGKDWVSGQSPSGSVGAALKATPDTGARITGSIASTSPELGYRVLFPSAGTYQLWLRGYGISNGNTLHAGLDGSATAQNVSVQTGAWRWAKASISVPSAGEHTVNLWMREDGMSVDRLLLSADAGYTPTGNGPAATPRSGGGEPEPDTAPPTLTGRQPASGATGVAVGANAVATFSEAMDPGTVGTGTFSLAPSAGGPAVAASIVASAGNTTFTLNPSADLAPGTAYTATVTTGAADAAGNNLASQQTWSFTTAAAPEPGGDGAVTFAGGLAVVEAEDQDAKVARGGKDWVSGQSPSGSVGAALKATPDTGARITGSIASTSPELGYRVLFPSAGTYQLWLRGYGISNGNTLHAGLDGSATAQNVSVQTGAWRWAKASISVPSAGEHTVNLWMREDGMSVDRLLLSADAGYTPTGNGPAATPRSGGGEPEPDTAPPTLTGRQPASGATGVAVGANAVATFSEAMDPGTVGTGTFSLAPSAGGPAVAASIVASAGNTTFTLNPSADLAPGTAYTATVTTGAADAAGNNLASQQTWSFTTAAAPEPGGDGAVTFAGGLAVVEAEDQDAKVARGGKDWVSGQSPSGSVGAALKATPDTGARITGSIASTSPELGYRVLFPSAGTYQLWLRGYGISNGNTLHAGLDGSATAQNVSVQTGAWRWAKASISVPSAGEHTVNLWMREDGMSVDRLLLSADAGYTPTGNGPAATPRSGGGEPEPDTAPPTLTGRQPASGATGVAVGANAVATFSEAMDPGTVGTGTFSLAPSAGGPAVAASIVASAGNTTFTLNPSADLAPGTAYTATVTTGAADAAGNNLASQQTWSFTTAAAPEPGGDGAVTFAGGLAVVEAEDHDARLARGGKDWTPAAGPAGAVGGALRATPDDGTNSDGPLASPELSWRVDFPSAGTYYLWARGAAPDGAGNSAYVGLDGAPQPSYLNLYQFDQWVWVGSPFGGSRVTLSVPSAGVHTVHAWMREDGFALDRLLIAADAGYSPASAGPPATGRG